MRAAPINLIGGFYADESRHWSVQDTCNWLPVVAEQQGTLTPAKLATPPGLRPYQQIGTGPIRGMHDCEGQRFVVSGRTLYRITNTGVGIPLGTVPGVGRVSISHNQFGGGNQVLVCNGAPGGGYVYDTRAQTFERITDPGFPGSLQTAYIDSYLLGVEPAGRFWFHSNLADATDYNTLDRYEAEAAPDRIVGLAVSQFEVIVFGERTAEFYGNAGGATGTFQSKRAVIDRGCASRHTICNLDNSVFWLGDDGIVYRLEGYAARRVSTVPLERALAGLRWSDAFAFAWEDKGHKVYYLTFPDGQTWGYDVVCGLWHRRESYGLSRWRLNDAVRWGNTWFGGDFQNGRIWQLDWDYPAEGDQPMVSERTSPVMSDNQGAFIAASVELIMGVGQQGIKDGPSGAFPPRPEPTLTISGSVGAELWADEEASGSYLVAGGRGPYFVHVASGSFPRGMELAPDGTWSGSPSLLGMSDWEIHVYDSQGNWGRLTDATVVKARPFTLLHFYEGDWLQDYGSLGLTYAASAAGGGVVPYVAPAPGGGHAARFESGADLDKYGRIESVENVMLSGDWTMETMVYNIGGNSGQCTLFGVRPAGFWTGLHISVGTGNLSGWIADANSPFVPMSRDQWHHVVWQRKGNDFELFIDGSLVSGYSSSVHVGAAKVEIGNWLNGYMKESRITVGRAIYPSAGFTPPDRHKPITEPLTEVP